MDNPLLFPSFFELITATAFLYFKEENVDIAIFEVGMGGRWDATNIVQPLVSILTTISYDHTEYLGEKLSTIAFEKCGIIKDQIPSVNHNIHQNV